MAISYVKQSMVVLATILSAAPAWANLQVFPTRVLLTEKNRIAQLSLRHTGPAPMKYRISTAFFRMDENGGMARVEDPRADERYAGGYFRYSPKQVELQPSVEQVVRVMLSLPESLAPGEYRAHMFFEGMEESAPKKLEDEKSATESRMELKGRMAIAIPVIVRMGEIKAEVKISGLELLKMPDQRDGFRFRLEQSGNAFTHGDIYLYYAADSKAEAPEKLVGQINAVTSYVPKRNVSYPFNIEVPASTAKGQLRLEFRAPQSQGGQLLASTSLELSEKLASPKKK